MKRLFLILIVSRAVLASSVETPNYSQGATTYATENILHLRGQLTPPPNPYALDELNQTLFSETASQSHELQRVKFHLLNGEFRHAKLYLNRLVYSQSRLKPIIYRYLGIIHFIEADFIKSYDYLKRPEINGISYYSKICVLKVLNQIILDKRQELPGEWNRCQIENFNNIKETNLIWLETLVQLKLNPRPGISQVPFKKIRLAAFQNDELKVFLKLSLYLNQEKLILDSIPELTLDQLQDPEVRELIGQLYFRTGSFAKAYQFIEDLKSPNSENIKGNLYVLRQKYELAYAQFKTALEQKQNSQNAMERLLPLAWILEDWSQGSSYAERVLASPQTQINKLTLFAAFLIQSNQFNKAEEVLTKIIHESKRGSELDVTQLSSFLALMQKKTETSKKYALQSCAQDDIVNCWLLIQLSQWENFPLTMLRPEGLPERKGWEKLTQAEVSAPLQETVYINQIDIEEMDDKLIQLIPSKN